MGSDTTPPFTLTRASSFPCSVSSIATTCSPSASFSASRLASWTPALLHWTAGARAARDWAAAWKVSPSAKQIKAISRNMCITPLSVVSARSDRLLASRCNLRIARHGSLFLSRAGVGGKDLHTCALRWHMDAATPHHIVDSLLVFDRLDGGARVPVVCRQARAGHAGLFVLRLSSWICYWSRRTAGNEGGRDRDKRQGVPIYS